MRTSSRLGALVFAALLATGAAADLNAQDTLRARVDSMARRMEDLELRLRQQEDLLRQRGEAAMAADERAAGAERDTVIDPRLRGVSGIYNRPFALRFGRGAAVGGYMDLEFKPDEPGGDDFSFVAHRMIPFIFAEITDRIHFGTELEFEYGGEEIKVEFAAADVELAEWLVLRGGLLLSPLGKFNLIHDSPVNDLTERPLVSRFIIPTTLTEAGLGINGTIYPSEQSVLTYELYAVNGFNEAVVRRSDAGAPTSFRIRNGRGSARLDNNPNKAIVGRLAFSPLLGLELGASGHTGVYANETPGAGLTGDERLTIWAVDGIFSRGPFELLGEYARASFDLPTGATFGDSQDGWYLQGNVHFGHGLIPLFPQSVFTLVGRWDQVDFDRDIGGDAQRRVTVGLNFRPVEETVFKFDWLHDWTAARGADFGDRMGSFEFSLATYF